MLKKAGKANHSKDIKPINVRSYKTEVWEISFRWIITPKFFFFLELTSQEIGE